MVRAARPIKRATPSMFGHRGRLGPNPHPGGICCCEMFSTLWACISRALLYQNQRHATTPIQVILLGSRRFVFCGLISLPRRIEHNSCRMHKRLRAVSYRGGTTRYLGWHAKFAGQCETLRITAFGTHASTAASLLAKMCGAVLPSHCSRDTSDKFLSSARRSLDETKQSPTRLATSSPFYWPTRIRGFARDCRE